MKKHPLIKIFVLSLCFILLIGTLCACGGGQNEPEKEVNTQDEIHIVENNIIVDITDYARTLSNIEVPNQINGVDILGIGMSVYSGCSNLKSVTIASSIKVIGQEAFRTCMALESVKFEDNSNLESIEQRAFTSCMALSTFDFGVNNNLQRIGQEAFRYCTALKNIIFPGKLVDIGNNAFETCGLVSVVFPPSLKKIGSSAFALSQSLEEVTFNKGLEELGAFSFNSCFSLASIKYTGTKAEWYAINRGAEWRGSGVPDKVVPAKNVVCSNGVA